MKVLILTCNTGEGHNSAAAALLEYFTAQGAHCEIADALRFISRAASELVCGLHVNVYRHAPQLFRSGYSYTEGRPSLLEENRLLLKALSPGADKLHAMLAQESYDALICVHVFSGLLLAQLRRTYGLAAWTGFITTDYSYSPFTCDTRLDTYFIPRADLAGAFIAGGVPEEKLVPAGIPLRQEFCAPGLPQAEARARLGLPAQGGHALLMCGSMGCGPMEELTAALRAALPPDALLSVVCGTNERLHQALARRALPNVRVYGFTREVPLLMDSADLFLTKPGGISISEAAAKGLPMVFVDAVGGCEAGNLRYFLERGWARTAPDIPGLAQACAALLADAPARAAMAQQLRAAFCGNPAQCVYTHTVKAVGG